VLGDIELFARAVRAPVIGVTGTNGKSTVTSLVAQMAETAGLSVLAGGNLGACALDLLDRPVPDLYVLELSSFQLETIESLALVAAVVLNVSADHLDRHASIDAYAEAKRRIFEHAATLVVNADDARVLAMRRAGARVITFSVAAAADYHLSAEAPQSLCRRGEVLLGLSAMKLSGLHNAANALAALALGEAAGLPLPAMLEALAAFQGLPHRCAWVAEIAGVRYLDDSKGTNVGATAAAVAGIPAPLVLIAGGVGKGQDFSPLGVAFRGKVRHVVLIGQDGAALARALDGVCTFEFAGGMDAAVRAAARAARSGDTVLLSPACASQDMFPDYAARGAAFAAAVRTLQGASA
jgi:UDP-N-acetylmuramoylalanine--D-glutamate ligase